MYLITVDFIIPKVLEVGRMKEKVKVEKILDNVRIGISQNTTVESKPLMLLLSEIIDANKTTEESKEEVDPMFVKVRKQERLDRLYGIEETPQEKRKRQKDIVKGNEKMLVVFSFNILSTYAASGNIQVNDDVLPAITKFLDKILQGLDSKDDNLFIICLKV